MSINGYNYGQYIYGNFDCSLSENYLYRFCLRNEHRIILCNSAAVF